MSEKKTGLEYSYDAEIDNRRELDSGSVKYDLVVKCKQTNETLVETSYTVSKRQEERLEQMIETFTEKTAREYENDLGVDHSGKTVSV